MAVLINMAHKKENDVLSNRNLSWKAKGIYSYLSTFDIKKNFKIDDLIGYSRENRIAAHSGVNELKAAKYLHGFAFIKHKTGVDSYLYILFGYPKSIKKEQKFALSTSLVYSQNMTRLGPLLDSYKELYNIINYSIKSNSNNIGVGVYAQNMTRLKKEVGSLTRFWINNLKRHKPDSKTFLKGQEGLNKKYDSLSKRYPTIKTKKKRRSIAHSEIMVAMRTYQKLFKLEEPVLKKKWPWFVGLDEFFGFSNYSKANLFENLKGDATFAMTIKSWFEECSKGLEYCQLEYGEDKNPVVSKKIAARLGIEHSKKRRLFEASNAFCDFFEDNKKKLDLPNKLDEHYPARFLKYFFKFLDYNFKTRKFNPYIMLNEDFLEVDFKDFLREMGWYRKI